MRSVSRLRSCGLCLILIGCQVFAAAEDEPADALAVKMQVTATRVAEASTEVPAAVTVVSGAEMRALGAQDLASALALVAGVAIAPGGDGGPASSVPELWGLREFDAFLLVVDGTPWGGAFNPALATLDLEGIERIEILRGAAPVMFGATSFVGVIHVIHLEAGKGERSASAGFGSYGSWNASTYLPLTSAGPWQQSLSARVEKLGLKDDRAGFERGHLLYRGAREAFGGRVRFDADLTFVRQDPSSPHPRQGSVLTAAVPLDANHNPSDAQQDENRYHLVAGFERKLGQGDWSTTLALDIVKREIVKGFLHEVSDAPGDNAAGFSQEQEESGFYFDSHWVAEPSATTRLIVGVDHLFGKGESEGANFGYHVGLDGSGAPRSDSLPVLEFTELEDERNFSGLYGQLEWQPAPRFRVELGGRLNATREKREGEVEDGGVDHFDRDSRNVTRGSGTLGVNYEAWKDERDGLWLFADYRNAFKPAAIDFGPEAESVEILKPETADSVELGAKGLLMGGRLDYLVSAFRMDFSNLVLGAVVNNLPVLQNAGEQRFEGTELELGLLWGASGRFQLSYAHHDSRFRDFVQIFDGVPTQLSGKRLEMAPQELAGAGLIWAPALGLEGSLVVNYIGDRYLNKRNSALAPSYTTVSAGLGWRTARWSIRIDGRNLSDERDPVAESELGESQYYRMTARRLDASVSLKF